jgi:hypothetical protein
MNSAGDRLHSGGLRSLWDMINFDFTEAHAALELLNYEYRDALQKSLETRKAILVQYVNDEDKAKALKFVAHCRRAFWDFGAESIRDRIRRFEAAMAGQVAWEDFASEYRFLRELLQDELKRHYFYHYSPAMGALLVGFEDAWEPVIKVFPSVEDEASSAVDCIALGHGTAGVFHLMRVLEKGLGALAGNVGKTFDTQVWNGIIDEIESAIKDLHRTLPKAEREKRLPFLSQAATEFRFFKDAWRNHVSHGRVSYDPDQAIGVMTHVRAFMTTLAKNGLAEWMA